MIQKLYILTSTSHIIVTCIQHFKVDIQNEIFLKKKEKKNRDREGRVIATAELGAKNRM
jgi:hypothetical protein